MPRPDEGLIHEWLDGELGPEEAERVARLVAEDAEWAAAAAEARGLIAASSRILSALDAVPGGVLPAGSRAAPPAAPRRVMRPWMRAAAGLVLVAGTTYLVVDRSGTPAFDLEPQVRESTPAAMSEASEAKAPTIGRQDQPAISAAPTQVIVPTPAPAPPPAEDQVTGLRTRSQAAERASDDRALGSVVVTAAGAESARTESASAEKARTQAANAEQAREALSDASRAERRQELDRAAVRPRAATALAAPTGGVSGFSAKSATLRALEGCWRTTTTGGADSVVVTPAILGSRGDTLEILVGPPTRPATVVRSGDVLLLGAMLDALGVRVTFRAARTECPPATPAPR